MPFIYDSDLPFSSPGKHINKTSVFIRSPAISTLSSMSMGGNNGSRRQEPSPGHISVAQALEIARDSPEGAQDPAVVRTLETALSEIWTKIQTQPTSYIMTRDEFAVFNYFQVRFEGQDLATSARKRYWDYLRVNSGGSS
jgi:hypothetical protein